MTDESIKYDIAPVIKGHTSFLQLINPIATLILVIGYNGKSHGELFTIETEGFSFSLIITNSQIELRRNQFLARVSLPEYSQNNIIIITASWSPELLRLGVMNESVERKQETKTPIFFPPNSLKEWARRNSLTSTIFYETPLHFFQVVFAQFEQLVEKIIDTNAINGFWDIHYSGSKIVSRTPKKEVDIHPQIRLLFYDIEILQNIQIIPEYPTGSGKLDFLTTGTLTNGKTISICVEFKLAHALDIAHGLQTQLPEYMDRKGTDYGIYCVLNFGEAYTTNLSKFLIKDLDLHLDRTKLGLAGVLQMAANNTGRKFLKTLIFDLSKQVSPSKK